jgi:hypothetical protein
MPPMLGRQDFAESRIRSMLCSARLCLLDHRPEGQLSLCAIYRGQGLPPVLESAVGDLICTFRRYEAKRR